MTVSGLNAHVVARVGRTLSEDAVEALRAGDISRLMEVNKAEFGGFRMMADGDDDDDEGDDDNDNDDDGDSGADDNDDNDDGDDNGDTISRAEFDKLAKRMKAADKRATEAEKKVKEAEDAKKGDLEKATSRVAELEEENKTLKGKVSGLQLSTAFLSTNRHTWHDGDTALALAQSKGYLDDVVDEDGEVDKKALKAALDKLAKEHKYLVKKSSTGEPDDKDQPSGDSAGGRSNNSKDKKARESKLSKRFPAMR